MAAGKVGPLIDEPFFPVCNRRRIPARGLPRRDQGGLVKIVVRMWGETRTGGGNDEEKAHGTPGGLGTEFVHQGPIKHPQACVACSGGDGVTVSLDLLEYVLLLPCIELGFGGFYSAVQSVLSVIRTR